MGAFDPGTKRGVDNVAREQPIGKLRQHGTRAVSEVRSIGGDVLGQGDDVAAADAVNRAAPPRGQDDLVKNALGGLRAAGPRLGVGVQFQELSNQRLDAVIRPRCCVRRRPVRGRVDPTFELMAGLGRSHPRGGERERAVARVLRGCCVAELEVAGPAAEAIAQRETLGAGRLHDEVHAVAVGIPRAVGDTVAIAPRLGILHHNRGELDVIPPAVTRVALPGYRDGPKVARLLLSYVVARQMRTSEHKVNGDANFCHAPARKSVGDCRALSAMLASPTISSHFWNGSAAAVEANASVIAGRTRSNQHRRTGAACLTPPVLFSTTHHAV